ncbi:hypothetical protein LguiB_009940 [Lonicera macranthoides]
MVGHKTIEAAKTVLEVADVAWSALEFRNHHGHHEEQQSLVDEEIELDSLRSENQRLKNLLEQNLKLLQNLSESPYLLEDCPPDRDPRHFALYHWVYRSRRQTVLRWLGGLNTRSIRLPLASKGTSRFCASTSFQNDSKGTLHARLVATVDSKNFLSQLKSQQERMVEESDCKFPFKEASGTDLQAAELLINVGLEEPSWWVWVTDEKLHCNVEERSGIDNENYVIISEEHVVDGVAHFMARCILSNPKAQTLTPEEMQKWKYELFYLKKPHGDMGSSRVHGILVRPGNKLVRVSFMSGLHRRLGLLSALTQALHGMNKFEKMLNVWHAGMLFYTLSTWGLALAGLYQTRAILKMAAMGVHHSSKAVLRVL